MPGELAAALAKVQAELPHIAKGATADTGSYSYEYADLTAVSGAILPLLGKHGLAFTARPTLNTDGKFVLAYSLLHASGEREDGEYPLADRGTPQQIGGYITYARRYSLCAITGVAPGGEDSDAAGTAEVEMQVPRHRSAWSDPEHTRLRQNMVQGPEPGTRRGPVPPEEDAWSGQPPGKLTPGGGTAGVIAQHFKRLEVLDREERLGYTAKLAGRDSLESTNDLTKAERSAVLRRLEKLRDHQQLVALVTNGDAP